MKYKQVIILRTDLKMSTGKTISQACHASLGSYRVSDSNLGEEWLSEGGKKVILKTENKEKLIDIQRKVKREGIACYLVRDAGKTEIESGTITALGIGPESENKIDKFTKSLSSF